MTSSHHACTRLSVLLLLTLPLLLSPSRAQDAAEEQLNRYVVSAASSTIQTRDARAEFAFDGNMKTRWSSKFEDDQWIECRFDRALGVQRIVIQWEQARASAFRVQTLSSKGNWVDVFAKQDARGKTDTITFPRLLKTDGIRIACETRNTQWGFSIHEVEFYGLADRKPPAINLIGWELPPNQWQLRERKIAKLLLHVSKNDPPSSAGLSDDDFLNLVQKRSFDFFWWETNPTNGLTKDRARNFGSSEEVSHASIAAGGFALAAYAIGVERGWTVRENAVERIIATLRTVLDGSVRNDHGFLPHFVSYFSGADTMATEISTIDTALFLAGMIVAMEYFQDDEITSLATKIFQRVNWVWAKGGHKHFVSHGVDHKGKPLNARWGSFTEGILIYLLGVGSPTYGLSPASWYAVDRHVGEYEGYEFIAEYGFQSMFRYQYPALFFDFFGRTDETGIDYFRNATVAALAMREYSLRKAPQFPKSYNPYMWGLSAADGPGNRYYIYGFPPGEPYSPVDGTVIPYAMAGCMSLLPVHALHSLRYLYDRHHDAWGKYGFTDAVNPTRKFLARDVIGIDVGTILIAIENFRTGLIWDLFMQNDWIKESTRRIKWKQVARRDSTSGPIDLARTHRWKFLASDGDFSTTRFDDSAWPDVEIPNRWEQLGASYRNYDGVGWYRTAFDMDRERLNAWKESRRRITLRIGAIEDGDTAYLNGIRIGQTRIGPGTAQKMRNYIVPARALKSGKNVLCVRVEDEGGTGGIWALPVEIGPDYTSL